MQEMPVPMFVYYAMCFFTGVGIAATVTWAYNRWRHPSQ